MTRPQPILPHDRPHFVVRDPGHHAIGDGAVSSNGSETACL